MQTETLDKLYLEWSQYTNARTAREIRTQNQVDALREALQNIINHQMAVCHGSINMSATYRIAKKALSNA